MTMTTLKKNWDELARVGGGDLNPHSQPLRRLDRCTRAGPPMSERRVGNDDRRTSHRSRETVRLDGRTRWEMRSFEKGESRIAGSIPDSGSERRNYVFHWFSEKVVVNSRSLEMECVGARCDGPDRRWLAYPPQEVKREREGGDSRPQQ